MLKTTSTAHCWIFITWAT